MGDRLYNYTIYKLHHKTILDGETYVGSSRQNIKTRVKKHKSNCHNVKLVSYNYKVYQHIRETGGFNNWQCTVLEVCDNITKRTAREIERNYMEELNSSLNTYRPYRTDNEVKEYKIMANKHFLEKNKDYFINYRLNNMEKITETVNCECGNDYTRNNKCHHMKTKCHKRFLENQKLSEKNKITNYINKETI